MDERRADLAERIFYAECRLVSSATHEAINRYLEAVRPESEAENE